MLIQSITVSEHNVGEVYQEFARVGNIIGMLKIDDSDLSSYIAPEVREASILSILTIAPYPILQYYLYTPIQGVSNDMRNSFYNFALDKGLIDPQSYTPFFDGGSSARTISQDSSSKPKHKNKPGCMIL